MFTSSFIFRLGDSAGSNGAVNRSAKANQQPEYETETVFKKNTIKEPGYGSGFHNLSDILSHILQHHSSWAEEHNSLQNSPSVSSPIMLNSNTSAFTSEANIGPSQNSKHSMKTLKSHKQHNTTRQSSLSPSAFRRKTNAISSENAKTKLRNLRKQLARLKAKLNKYLHLARRQRRKHSNPNNKLRSKIINKPHHVPRERAST